MSARASHADDQGEIVMGSIGITEILVVAGIAVLLFGAGRIADVGKGMGQAIKNFKQGVREARDLDESP
jgi:sec-independent protein translocase protein TatA